MTDLLVMNGIDGTSGQYATPPISLDVLRRWMSRDSVREPGVRGRLRRLVMQLTEPHAGLPAAVDPTEPAQAGWGVVLPQAENPQVERALIPLIEHRRRQIGRDDLVKVLDYEDGESWARWLSRHDAGPGAVRPAKVPFYLLIAGSPARIPFAFSSQLGTEYCVGRLHFERPSDYDAYVAAVVEYETAESVPNRREATFFGTRHSFDPATQLSADNLVTPLAQGEAVVEDQDQGMRTVNDFRFRWLKGSAATKAELLRLLCDPEGGAPPVLLFTATHGVTWPRAHERQRSAQGALICEDWPGFGDLSAEHYVQATDVIDQATVRGLLAFHFACYSAGTPLEDRFRPDVSIPPRTIAPEPFLAALPQALLARGALAVVGHVERAWAFSIQSPGASPDILPFQNAVDRLLGGIPVGYAMRDFSEKYATSGNYLATLLERAEFDRSISPLEVARTWVQRNDAEGYLILGDPAVRVRLSALLPA